MARTCVNFNLNVTCLLPNKLEVWSCGPTDIYHIKVAIKQEFTNLKVIKMISIFNKSYKNIDIR